MNTPAPATICILGGGQLARMMVLAGAPLGVHFQVVDTHADVCAAPLAPVTATRWDDLVTLGRLAAQAQVITFDYENVPAETARWLTGRSHVAPNPHALATAQDRLAEKTLFQKIGLPTAAFRAVNTRAELQQAIADIGAPAILKTRRMGYDGKGQYRLQSPQDADAAWAALGEPAALHGLILESLVAFDQEVSVIAVRNRGGDFRPWPLTRNHHVGGILSMSIAPAAVPDTLVQAAFAHARKLAEALDYVGVFALELFVRGSELLGNEMAPRVHNSGHWTLDGAVTSQFENHIRAILDLPLGDTTARCPSAMFNWIGELPNAAAFLATPDTHWHAYDKAARPGRKVGHATVCAPDQAELQSRLQQLAKRMDLHAKVAPLLT